MLTLQPKSKGVDGASEILAIRIASENGGYADAAGSFDAAPSLSCVLWPGGDRAAAATLPASWHDAALALAVVDFPAATIDALDVGVYSGRLTLADLSAELAQFRVEILSGPGTGVARPVYHTFKQLKDECTWIDRLSDHLEDETGFAEVAADVRERIDGVIIARAASCNGYPGYGFGYSYAYSPSPYATALAADGLDLTTPGGLRIVWASVYMTLAVILRRADGMSNAPEDLLKKSVEYERRAKDELNGAWADFTASGLASIRLGGRRLVR